MAVKSANCGSRQPNDSKRLNEVWASFPDYSEDSTTLDGGCSFTEVVPSRGGVVAERHHEGTYPGHCADAAEIDQLVVEVCGLMSDLQELERRVAAHVPSSRDGSHWTSHAKWAARAQEQLGTLLLILRPNEDGNGAQKQVSSLVLGQVREAAAAVAARLHPALLATSAARGAAEPPAVQALDTSKASLPRRVERNFPPLPRRLNAVNISGQPSTHVFSGRA